jgi:chemotaxis protein CheD
VSDAPAGGPLRPARRTSTVERRIGVADYAVSRTGVLVTAGLGSCVAIVLHDGHTGVGGMAHVLLPDPALSRDGENPAKFPCSAVPLLLAEMRRLGGGRAVTARLVGGASMFRPLLAAAGLNVGERNVLASRRALEAAGVPLVAEDVGGEHGRSVVFDVRSGSVLVRSMRAGDRAL